MVNNHKRESSPADTSRTSARVTSAQAWLTSSQLQSHLIGAVSELQSALNKTHEAEDGDSTWDEQGKLIAKRGARVTKPDQGSNLIFGSLTLRVSRHLFY